MARVKFERGHFRVLRWCCTSGCCVDCHMRGNHGDKNKRTRVLQGSGYSQRFAEYVAGNWHDYGAVVELCT